MHKEGFSLSFVLCSLDIMLSVIAINVGGVDQMGNFRRRFSQYKGYFGVAIVALLIGIVVTVGCTSLPGSSDGRSEKNGGGQAQAAPMPEASPRSLSRLPGDDPNAIAASV